MRESFRMYLKFHPKGTIINIWPINDQIKLLVCRLLFYTTIRSNILKFSKNDPSTHKH